MIRCIIVDDEVLAQQVIQNHIQRIESLKLVGVCYNAIEATELLRQQDVDLIFLDIQLPGMTGLHFLRTLENPPLVVLTTAYAEYALESYEFSVIDYLLKPISFERFNKTVSKLLEGRLFTQGIPSRSNPQTDYIFIKSGSKFFKVNFSEIVYIQGMKDYLKIHTNDYKLVTHQTMTDMEDLLPARQFIRVHKSYIVSLAFIKSIYSNDIEIGGATIPIGNSYKNKLMDYVSRKSP
jgi:DNA-binding LytR/AlgR family response regulator